MKNKKIIWIGSIFIIVVLVWFGSQIIPKSSNKLIPSSNTKNNNSKPSFSEAEMDRAIDLVLNEIVKTKMTNQPKECLKWNAGEEGTSTISYYVWEGREIAMPGDVPCSDFSMAYNQVIKAIINMETGKISLTLSNSLDYSD